MPDLSKLDPFIDHRPTTNEPGYTQEDTLIRQALADTLQRQIDELANLANVIPMNFHNDNSLKAHRLIRSGREALIRALRQLTYTSGGDHLIDDYVKD